MTRSVLVRAALVFLTACLLLGCDSPEIGDPLLLGRLEAVVDPGVNPRITRERGRVDVAGSERAAVVSVEGLSWQTTVHRTGRPRLELALSGLGPAGPAVEAIIELGRGRQRREILRVEVPAGEAWQHHSVELEGRGETELILRSTGPRPVAWAEVHIVRKQPSPSPNLILISLDTLRADRLACYGHERPTSPNLDRLAADGYLFTQSRSSSTWTLPSTATMLTGLLPDQHRAQSIPQVLDDQVDTVAERLLEAGYRTAAFTDGGFLGPRWGFTQGFLRYDSTGGEAWDATKDVAIIEKAASAWLRENRFEPFFLFIHTYETHQPYANAEGFADPFLERGGDADRTGPLNAWSLEKSTPGSDDHRRALALYDGEIARVDHYVGRILDLLRREGRYDDTAILVTSDHGEEFLEHGGVEHANGKVFDENVRVPMIFKPPGNADGVVVSVPTSGVDVAPTLLGLAGLPVPTSLTGRSLLELATASDPAPRAALVLGLSSLPGLSERLYRLDVGAQSIVFDRERRRVDAYDRVRDPGMLAPTELKDSDPGDVLLARLQLMLAWASPHGRFLSLLPREADRISGPPGSGIQPLGVWDGLRWIAMAERRSVRMRPETPHILVFDAGPADADLIVDLGWPESGDSRARIERGPSAGWDPFNGAFPDPLTLVPTAEAHRRVFLELEAHDLEELRALGYIR